MKYILLTLVSAALASSASGDHLAGRQYFYFPTTISKEQFKKCSKWLAKDKKWKPVMVITDMKEFSIESMLQNLMDDDKSGVELDFSLWPVDEIKLLRKWNVKKLPAFVYEDSNKAHILQGCDKDPEELLQCKK